MVGSLIVSRYPANVLGWVFCAMGLSGGIGRFASGYASYTLIVEPGSLPFGAVAAWIGRWTGDADFFSFVFIPLLFPAGRPLSRRWWPLVWPPPVSSHW